MTRMSRLVSLSRESELTDYDADEALADESIHTDVVTEVEMPAQEISDASDDIEEAVDDSESLQNTADMLNETVEDGGQGVDPVAAELVQEKVEAAIERYQLSIQTRRFSKESFNTVSSRREVTRRLASEAEETSKGIWQRVKDGFRSVIEWVKNFLKTWLTAHGRLHRRVKALKEKYNKDETEVNVDRVEMPASRLGNDNVLEEVVKLRRFVDSNPLDWLVFYSKESVEEIKKFNSKIIAPEEEIKEFNKKMESKILKNKNLFEESGGSLGGKRVTLILDEDRSNFKVKVEELFGRDSKEVVKGVTKKDGKDILLHLDHILDKFSKFKKVIVEGLFASQYHYQYITSQEYRAGEKTFLEAFRLIMRYSMNVNKIINIAVNTSLKVASVATDICARSIGPAKENN